jgi:GT2 family glycosyltransferase
MGLNQNGLENTEPKVFILIVVWNNPYETLDCLESLSKIQYDNYEIIILDNNSQTPTRKIISHKNSSPEIIVNDSNLGFAKACNIGIDKALDEGASYIWLLNPDTQVNKDSLRSLVDTAKSEQRVGAVGSVIKELDQSDDPKVQMWGGGVINFVLGRGKAVKNKIDEVSEIDYLTGGSLLLSREALEEVGYLDERFFMYWEDVDYSIRLRRNGWALLVAENSVVYHKESSTLEGEPGKLDILFNESAVKFFKKHSGLWIIPVTLGTIGKLIKRLVKLQFSRVYSVLKGTFKGLRYSSPT